MKFYKKLKELRIAHNETQQELAEHLNLSFQSISKWENIEPLMTKVTRFLLHSS